MPTRDSTHDYLILGAGHNGLITQAYLARAGFSTLALDRRDRVGGGLATMEDPRHPGFRHNTHSFFHRGITGMPWYRELELDRHGAEYIEPELCTVLVRRDGEVLHWWRDIDRTCESFARFNRKDAVALRRWHDRFVPIVRDILEPEAQRPPVPAAERDRTLRSTPEGRLLQATARLSPLEFVEREFENPFVKAGLLFFNGLREVDLRCAGFGHHIPALFASAGRPQMAVGGSHALARALDSAIRAFGGEFLLNATPEEILVRDGRAVGVRLRDGRVARARRGVVSSLNPGQTFRELLPAAATPADWRERAAGFRYNLLAPLFALNLNLKEPPDYRAAARYPEINDALMIVLGLEDSRQFHDIVTHHERGTIPPTVMWGACPTRFDPTQAPAGAHTAFMWEKLPFHLEGDAENWDHRRRGHGEHMLALWREFAPNLETAVLDHFTRSPLDTARTLPNMREGDLLVGSFEHGQIGDQRPFAGAGRYHTVVPGLYLCGASSHPGGNVTGLPGYNAARAILSQS